MVDPYRVFCEVWQLPLYGFALANANIFSTSELKHLTLLGARMGVTGSGAPNQSQAVDFENRMVDELHNRLDVAIANNDIVEVANIVVAQGALGDAELAARANEAFEALQ